MLRISTIPLVLLAALGLLLGPAVALHGPAPLPNTGKIAGIVTDEAGDPLPSANVVLSGTAMGAVTNIDGEYIILGIPEGTYEVTASFVGYTSVTTRDVQVAANLTRILDFELSSPSDLQEIVVEYEGPAMKNDAVGVARTASGDASRMHGLTSYVSPAPPPPPGGYIPGVQTYNPLPTDREGYAAIDENPFKRVGDAPLSTFGIDVDAASYANTRRFLNSGRLPPADAVRIEEFVNYFTYDYPDPEGPTGEGAPFSITTEVAVAPWQPAHRLVRIGLQGRRIDTEDLPPANLVFLLDVSGSMGSADKLPLLKSALRLLVNELREEDTVAIAVYAGAAGVVLEPTSGADKETILEALDRLEAGGSTAGGQGIRLAYQLARQQFDAEKNNRVLLATDGDFNVGASSDAEMQRLIEEERESGVFLSVLGFGQGNLQDSKMEAIANHGNGNYAYIDTIQEAQKTLVAQMGGTLFNIAKDVKLQI
ncbi:MAG: von Willebrand factor type A domain-containing protein, partial [Bacteroidota bacterium]